MKKGRRMSSRSWFKALLALLAIVVLVLVLTPVGVKYFLATWLKENGAETAVIETLRINPFFGRVTVGGVEVEAGGRSLLHNEATVLDIDLFSLLDRTVHLKQAEYRDLSVEVEQLADGGWRIGSYTLLAEGQGEPDGAVSGKPVDPWSLRAERVLFDSSRIHLKTPDLDLVLIVDRAELLRLATREGYPAASLQLDGRLNDQPLQIALDHLQLVPDLQVTGTVSLQGFDLAAVAGTVDHILTGLAGSLGFNGNVSVMRTNEGALAVEYTGEISCAGVSAGSADFAANLRSLDWQGRIGFDTADEQPQLLAMDGALTMAAADLEIGEAGTIIGVAGMEVHGRVQFDEQINVDGHGNLALRGLQLAQAEKQLGVLDGLELNEVSAVGRELTVAAVQAKGVQTWLDGALPVSTKIDRIALADLESDDLTDFRVRELRAEKTVVTALRTGEEVVRVAEMTVRGGETRERQTVTIAGATLNEVILLPEDAGSAADSAASVSVLDMSEAGWYPDQGITGDTVTFSGLSIRLDREADGGLTLNRRLAAMMASTTNSATEVAGARQAETEAGAGAVPFSLGALEIERGSTVVFTDHSLRVPLTTTLNVDRLSVGSVSSAEPDMATKVLLHGDLEGRAPVQISGTIAPFLPEPVLDLHMSLKNYPLRNLSAYTVQSVGTGLASGQMDLVSDLQVADNRIEMSNTLELLKLETQTIDPELAAELDNQLPLPLDGALAMLRDSEGNIKLDVPLNGSFDDLQVGVSDVLITALGKAIVPAASGYLMYALGPYGALAYVGVKLGEKMLEVTLPPVSFAPREFTVTAEHEDYLQRIATILKDRPDTDVQLCPVVGSWELLNQEELESGQEEAFQVDEQTRQPLLDLGQLRGEAVKAVLADSHGIDRERLLICDTRIDQQRQAQPAVMLQMR